MQNKLRTQEEYEDIFQEALKQILPNVKPSDIRPAFNKDGGNIVAKNFIGKPEDNMDGLVGFTNRDQFVYFRVTFDDATDEIGQAEVHPDDTVEINRPVKLYVYNYGDGCMDMALYEKGLMRSNTISTYLNNLGIYLLNESGLIPVTEYVNSVPWTRCDITFVFNEIVKLNSIKEIGFAVDADEEVIVDGNVR